MIGVDGEKESSARNISINMDRVITDVNIDEYDMLVLPGGIPGVHSLSACDKLTTALKKFKEEGKWLAAICAGPTILGKLGLLEDEKATCYPGCEVDLHAGEHLQDGVVVSGKVITGKGAGYALDFGLKILEIATNKEQSDNIKKAMLVK